MKKRIMAVLLAVILVFSAKSEIIYAVSPQQTGQADIGEESGESGNLPADDNIASGDDTAPGDGTASGDDTASEGEETYYIVSFDTDGGSSVPYQQIKKGECLDESKIEEPVKTGYIFEGWKFDGQYYDLETPVMADLTLQADWKPITYTVHFDGNGGAGDMPDQEFTYDTADALHENNFTKEGYTFEGWSLNGELRDFYGTLVENLADEDGAVITLKAVWTLGTYEVSFKPNGGTGEMTDQSISYNEPLVANAYKRAGYAFAGWNTKKDGTGIAYKNKGKFAPLPEADEEPFLLYAMWTGNPYQVKYDANGGTGSMANSNHIYGTESNLSSNCFTRKGYVFNGWNTKKGGTGTSYNDLGIVTKLTTKKNKVVTLYAKWKAVKYTLDYDTKGGTLPKGYRSAYTIETKTFTLPKPTRTGYDFDGWYTDATYKSRVDQIKQGTTGNKKYYAKWVRCTTKAKSDSAKITACKVSGTEKITIKATIKKRIASSDDYYYLVYLNPNTKKAYKMAARTYKKSKITFSLKTSENRGYALGYYQIAIKKSGKYQVISSSCYIKNPEKLAKNKTKYQLGKTKKGIQFSSCMEELEKCDAKNTFLNLTASMVYNGSVPYIYNGKTYYFNSMDSYKQIVSECNKKKINVSMQILLDWVDPTLVAAKARVPGAALYYSWNTSSNSSREKMEAMFCYLGGIFGQKDCYVSNWILGNEINNPSGWNYSGSMSKTAYFRSYATAFRSLYYAAKSQYSNAKIFICMDNCWNSTINGYSVKDSISCFVKALNKIQKGIKWNLAYHAYSYPLTNTKVWKGIGVKHKSSTRFVTPENLNVLTDYIKKNYGSSVRIILSEQGFSSTGGLNSQAAALAYSYYAAACNPMVDAFIIRSYTDHPVEVAQGLSMGIYGKPAFKVFKYMDTSRNEIYTNKYLKLIRAKSWKQVVSGYKKSRVRKIYRKG